MDNATLSDLDDMALAKARVMFKRVHAANIPPEEVDGWSTEEFLSHSEVMREGHLTRAAILLLGKPESLSKIYPAVARITWTLEDKDEIVQDYEHFTVPFIMTVDEVLSKIRNMTMRELPGGTLFPDTMKQYDSYTIRETIHNSVAHQDYQKQERINFVERPDSIYCSNGGSFLPGTIEEALEHKGPQRHYRNECLCRGMVNFNMIDTVGRGIKKMFSEQRKRFFPMPDYDIDNEHGEVGVTIYGKMIDEKYTQLLRSGTELSLKECIWLDAIQKRRSVSPTIIKYLKAHKLIEGRAPYYTISLTVARMTGQLTKYTHERGLEREKIVHMLDQFILNAGEEGVKRDAIFDYVKETLPGLLDDEHQLKQLSNYLSTMQKDGLIACGNRRWHSCRKNH